MEDRSAQRNQLRARGICIIIPTFNNAGTIADVTRRSFEQCKDVIVVCDGCTDNTVKILEEMTPRPEIVVLNKNCGKGCALKEGFKFAKKAGFSYAITLDGDGQHYPEDIPELLEANIKNPGALIIGQRKNLENVERSSGSKFANAFSNFWFAVQTGHYLKDTQTGYRLYPLNKLGGLKFLTSRYEAELELLVFSSWKGVKLVSTPVNVYYPPKEERVSHFRPIVDFTRISILNGVLCVLALIIGLPMALFRLICSILRSLYSITIFTIASIFVITPVVFIYLGIGKKTQVKKERLHRFICFMSRFVLYRHGIPGVKYTLVNNSGEDFSVPSVIVCNHQSHLDLMPMLALTPKLIVLTTDWVWNSPFYGYIIRSAEFLPVSMGIDAIMPQLKSLVERGYSIAVYPEGTRSLDCSIGRFHQGACYIAENLGLDIIPAVLYGTGKALPKHGRYLRKWPISLDIDKRITNHELALMGPTNTAQAASLRKYYQKRYSQISNTVERYV